VALRPARGVAWQTIDDEGVVLDLDGGRSFGLNGPAALVFSLLETHGEEEIARALARRFEVGAEEAHADVAAFLATLRERGLVVEE
jgi:PqqD family protein of HPr-rel-A system